MTKEQPTLTSQVATKYLMDECCFLTALIEATMHQCHCLCMHKINTNETVKLTARNHLSELLKTEHYKAHSRKG